MEIAVSALSGVMDALPAKLGALIEQEYALLAGARNDVSFLYAELRSMHAFLVKCAELENPDIQTKEWARQVHELAYDIEDRIELFAHRVDGAADHGRHDTQCLSLIGWFRNVKGKIKTLPARHGIAIELQVLKERVIEVSQQRQRYWLDPPVGGTQRSSFDHRQTALYADIADLVGIDGPSNEVVEMMDLGSAGLKVVSIVGMAGAGKTALAAVVSRRLREQFQCGAFVSVGQTPDTKKVLKNILNQVEGCRGGDEMADVGQLIRMLKQHLQDKRYFIIIDDLWTSQAWTPIRCSFPENNLGSRIMTSTRNEAVAKSCCSGPDDRIYKIRLLNDIDSKALFSKRIFHTAAGCPPYERNDSNLIMKKCGGLPLAIVSICNMLASKDLTMWERFGLDLQANSYLDGMKQILNLSYNDLPQHLKASLLYLSIFPVDYKIDKERLVRRWIAEGFVGEVRGSSSRREEIANSYFNELISRNMIQPLDVDFDGKARSCTLHPVMLKFIVSKSIEENFVALLHTRQQDVSNNKARLLSLHCDKEDGHAMAQGHMMNFSNARTARSLTLFGHANGMPNLGELNVIRVLDLENCKGPVEQHLDGLCKVLLLKYLSLKGTDVSKLPRQIGDLRCLETLDVRSTKVKELPTDIVGLEKLVHLLAGFIKLPDGIGKMRALQSLSCVDVGKSSISVMWELSELPNLRDLTIFCDAIGTSSDQEHRDSVLSSLGRLASLHSLTVVGSGGCSVNLDSLSPPPHLECFHLQESKLQRVPGWMAECSSLVDVDISIEELSEDGLKILQGLPNLLQLYLSLLFVPQEPFTFYRDKFQSLKQLCFRCIFPSLTFEPGTLPNLEGLGLKFERGPAEDLSGVSGIKCLPSLNRVSIEFSHWDACAVATVDAVRNAANMIHPKHPAVTVEGGREV